MQNHVPINKGKTRWHLMYIFEYLQGKTPVSHYTKDNVLTYILPLEKLPEI